MPGTHVIDAVVLAGGRSRRFGSDKVTARVGGRTLLDIAVDAVSTLREVVVVGPERDVPLRRPVVWAREEPEFGGPVAGLSAGLRALPDDSDAVLLLAADLPRADELVARLLDAPLSSDAVVVTDQDGSAQWTASLVRCAPLREALGTLDDPDGTSLRHLFTGLGWDPVTAPAGATWDVDTPDDLRSPR